MPGGLGFDIYPPGQKLTIYLQKVGFASGTPVAVLTMAKLPGGVTSTTVTQGRVMRNARMGEGTRRQEGTFSGGSASSRMPAASTRCRWISRDVIRSRPACTHMKTACARRCWNTDQATRSICCCACPWPRRRGLGHRALSGARRTHRATHRHLGVQVNVEQVARAGTRGSVDCSGAPRAVLTRLRFTAE